MRYNYKVEPVNPEEIDVPLSRDIDSEELQTQYKEEPIFLFTKGFAKIGCLGCSGLSSLFFIYLLILGIIQGQHLGSVLGVFFYLICSALPIIGYILYSTYTKRKLLKLNAEFDENARRKKEHHIKQRKLLQEKLSIEQADKLSNELNRLLEYSSEIKEKTLPFYSEQISTLIKQALFELENKGYNPFWEKMEETLVNFNTYNYLSIKLNQNKKFYNDLIYNVESNFPKPFPIGDYKHTEVKAFLKKFESIKDVAFHNEDANFTHTYNNIKLQKINISGFNSLESAINNMSRAIQDSISELEISLSNSLNEIIRNQELTYDLLNDKSNIIQSNLNEINNRLYNMHHKVKPVWPYIPR